MCVPGTGGGGAIASPDGGVAACSSPLARGDFDGDGVDDCLLTVPSDALGCPSQSIFFYKGLGTSTYATTPVITPYAVPVGAQGTAIGLSGDACADLLLSTFDGPSSATSFGYVRSQCDGTFGPIPVPFGIALGSAVTYSLGYWVSGGDFTGDGRPDRVTVARTVPNARAIHWITMSDRGDPPSNGLVVRDTDSGLICGNNGSVGLSIGKGDFNNDGKLDVMATVDYRGLDVTNAYSEVIIGLGDGQGGFSRTIEDTATKVTSGSLTAAVVDANSDGKLDLSVSNGATIGQIFYGDGAGNFSTSPP